MFLPADVANHLDVNHLDVYSRIEGADVTNHMDVEPFSIAMAVPFSIAKGESLSMIEGCMALHLVKSAEVAHAFLDAKADVQAIDEYRHGRALQHRHGRALQHRQGRVPLHD